MTQRTATHRTSQVAFEQHAVRAESALATIAAWLATHRTEQTNGNWGCAGSMAHFASELEEVASEMEMWK